MTDRVPLPLLSAYGIELEYMIVDRETLAVRPIADDLLRAFCGGEPVDKETGPVGWSNELVRHVIELKTNGPTPALAGWAARFGEDIALIDAELARAGAMLLPGAMHPTMDPARDTVLWPHDSHEIYEAYDRIFGCRRHGWANLQSCHVNLPFAGDAEFARLHSAIRVVLALVPALAASSPVIDGRVTGILDNRLHVYLTHQARIPSAMGLVIPEVVHSRAEYDAKIFQPILAEITPLDPDGVLEHEFLNARGAIARFQRDAVEIRLLDVQETPRADLAIALLVTAAVRALTEERWVSIAELDAIETEALVAILKATLTTGECAELADGRVLAAFGRNGPRTVGALWSELAAELRRGDADWRGLGPTVDALLAHGPLARRIVTALDAGRSIPDVYGELARCLVEGRLFGVTG